MLAFELIRSAETNSYSLSDNSFEESFSNQFMMRKFWPFFTQKRIGWIIFVSSKCLTNSELVQILSRRESQA